LLYLTTKHNFENFGGCNCPVVPLVAGVFRAKRKAFSERLECPKDTPLLRTQDKKKLNIAERLASIALE